MQYNGECKLHSNQARGSWGGGDLEETLPAYQGVIVVPEHGGRAPFRHIFLSLNGAPVNNVYHSRTAAFRQAARTITKSPYSRNLANWFSGKSLKLLPPDVRF